jgi:broad specificity phosphatase PhoE
VGVLLLVRHGQASLGSADYDRLSALGYRQARLVGARLARASTTVRLVQCGGLLRQRETARVAMAELGLPPGELGIDHRLDEYDHTGLLGQDGGDRFAAATTPRSRRDLQSALDQALGRWIAGGSGSTETHAAFTARVGAAVADLTHMPGGTMAVTSAGVIAVACAQLTGLPAARWPELAKVIVNASVTTLITGRTGTHLLTFNDHAHLEGDRSLVTYR